MQWESMSLNCAKTTNGDVWGVKWPVILILLLFPLFFIGGPDYYSSRSFKNFWNVGHVVFFALFSYQLLIHGRLFRNKSFFQNLFLCLFISTILGFFIEFAQNGFNREVDINDLWRNLLGASIGFFLSPMASNKLTKTIVLYFLAAILILQSIPWFLVLADEIKANLTFPVLSDFESEVEATRWSGNAAFTINDEMAFSGDHSLRVDLGTEKYSGIGLRYFPKDWSEYQNLIFEIFNPGDNLEINVRIHDRLHTQGEELYSDRFNRKLTLHKGWNTINIELENVASAPVTRQMDLSSVSGLGVFVVEQSVAKRIYLDAVKLVKIYNDSLKPDKSTKNRRQDL